MERPCFDATPTYAFSMVSPLARFTGSIQLPNWGRGKDRQNRRLLLVWKKVAIALPHFFGLMAHPGVDEPLIDAVRGTVGRERMSEDVPAPELHPFAALQGAVEVVVNLVASCDRRTNPLCPAPGDEKLLAENLHAARMT